MSACIVLSFFISLSIIYPDRLTNECLKDALGVLLVPLTNLFNFCFSHGCCPPQWCHSYLLTLYKGKGSKSDPNSARGIALQSRLLNIYCYLLDQRLYHWAEGQSLIPREQHGFRSGKSTMSAIADLSAWVKDSLSKPKCPLYTIYVDFTKAFDSSDRSRLFAKLNDMGVSATFIKALWPIFKQNNFQVILPNQSLSDPITQTLGVPQGQCLSPHLYTLYTADMPAIVKGGDDYLQCLVYADDLAICSNNLCAIQQSIDRLYKYCSDNYLGIN